MQATSLRSLLEKGKHCHPQVSGGALPLSPHGAAVPFPCGRCCFLSIILWSDADFAPGVVLYCCPPSSIMSYQTKSDLIDVSEKVYLPRKRNAAGSTTQKGRGSGSTTQRRREDQSAPPKGGERKQTKCRHTSEAKQKAAPSEREVKITITYMFQKMKKTRQEMHWPMHRKQHPRTHGSPAAPSRIQGRRRGKWSYDGRKAADCPKKKND